MNKKFFTRLAVCVFSIAALAGCGSDLPGGDFTCVTRTPAEANIDFEDTPCTDYLKLGYTDEELASKKFAFDERLGEKGKSDAVGFVDLRSSTDGDTANFVQDGLVDPLTGFQYTLKTRFLGINTPESTARIEPWGNKASRFTRTKLEAAQANADQETAAQGKKIHNIVLITDPDVWGIFEASGKRWLAFVWYRPTVNDDWRNLNLELVEQGYSENKLYSDSSVCDYRKVFEQAELRCKQCKYRVHGELDDGFDYERTGRVASLYEIVHNYDELGANKELGTSGKRLRVLAQVIGTQGDNMVLRDVMLDKKNGQKDGDELQCLYAFLGYNTAFVSVLEKIKPETHGIGAVIFFYCNASMRDGNVQLTSVEYNTIGTPEKIRAINEQNAESLTGHKWSEFTLDVAPKRVEPETITTVSDIAPYQYKFINTDLTIRKVSPSTDDDVEGENTSTKKNEYWAKSNQRGTAYTIYAHIKGNEHVAFNLRLNEGLNPSINPKFFDSNYGEAGFDVNTAVGKSFRVTGYVLAYFEKFQITFCNNYAQFNYISMLAD